MNDKSQSRGVRPRTPITFFMRLKKIIKETPPRFAAPAASPALLDWSGGCGTRAMRSNSPRRLSLTSLRYSAALRGGKTKKPKIEIQAGNKLHTLIR